MVNEYQESFGEVHTCGKCGTSVSINFSKDEILVDGIKEEQKEGKK